MGFLHHDLDSANAITGCHGEIGDGREGGDESSQNMEKTFLLQRVNDSWKAGLEKATYHWDTEGHKVKGTRREEHADKHNPVTSYSMIKV